MSAVRAVEVRLAQPRTKSATRWPHVGSNEQQDLGTIGKVSTRYLARSDLASLLRASPLTLAHRAADGLQPTDVELVPIAAGTLDLHTYEVRWRRAASGEGPQTIGLREFVEALRQPTSAPESCSVTDEAGTTYVILLDRGEIAAITAVVP
jgi:hypothetical protein